MVVFLTAIGVIILDFDVDIPRTEARMKQTIDHPIMIYDYRVEVGDEEREGQNQRNDEHCR